MDKRKRVKVKMYHTTNNVMDTHKETLSKLPGYPENAANFSEKLADIEESNARSEFDGSGITQINQENRDKLENDTMSVVVKLKAYAKINKDYTLLNDIDYTASELSKLAAPVLINASQSVHIRATEVLPQAAGYELKQADLDSLSDSIAAYKVSSTQPALNRLDKKQSKNNQITLYKEADDALGQIDTVIEIIRYSNPSLYELYKNARKMESLSQRSVTLKGVVTDMTENSISGVLLTFLEVDESNTLVSSEPVITKSTADKGGFVVKTLDEGRYRVTATKVGYKAAEQIISINGDNPNLVFRLETV